MSKKYKTDAMAAIHEIMEDLHAGGVIDKKAMRRFDQACLIPIGSLRLTREAAGNVSKRKTRSIRRTES